jgi:Abnormal spindle-like microcephaly-assoc'd, ASPM-SPD-2-Hydin
MPLSPAMSRSLLATAVIAMLLASIPCAQASAPGKPTSSNRRLIFTPATLAFGKVAVRHRKFQMVTITNAGASEVTLLQVTTQGTGFTVIGLDFPLTLASGESFTFSAIFAPQSIGASDGSISFVSQAPDAPDLQSPIPTLGLTGTGDDDQLTVDPAALNFGTVQVGRSASQIGTLFAGSSQVTISTATSSNPEFVVSGLSFPLTIPPGGHQEFLVTFTPQATVATSGTLSFMDVSGTDPLATESLSGVGTVSQGHSVNLSWNASTSENVIGYNVCRGLQSGGPYSKINSALDPNLSYTDTSVDDGTTYYYVTTSVNSNDQESVYSNEAQATIP